jgi:hypothetical protein
LVLSIQHQISNLTNPQRCESLYRRSYLLCGCWCALRSSKPTFKHILSLASAKDIDLAVAAARNAFNTIWGKNVTGFERSRLINKLADLIERDAQELAELESLNNGKPVKIARY